MKILEKIKSYYAKNSESVIFDSDGEFIVNSDNCFLMDVLMMILACQKYSPLTNQELRVELLKCHIFISYPELVKALNYLVKMKLITIGNIN